MDEINRVRLTVAGQVLKISTDESSEYLEGLAELVNREVDGVRAEYPNLSMSNCVALAFLNMADELTKLRTDYAAIDQRITQLRELPRSEAPSYPVKRPFESRQKTPTK